MTSKAAARRKRKHRNQQAQHHAPEPQQATSGPRIAPERPTPERMAKGKWHEPDKYAPLTDLAADMIGRLAVEGAINRGQLDAARLFEEIRAAYVAELGLTGFGSCLHMQIGAYDNGDGNLAAVRAYLSLEQRIGRVKSAVLQMETGRPPTDRPFNLGALRAALDAVNGV